MAEEEKQNVEARVMQLEGELDGMLREMNMMEYDMQKLFAEVTQRGITLHDMHTALGEKERQIAHRDEQLAQKSLQLADKDTEMAKVKVSCRECVSVMCA